MQNSVTESPFGAVVECELRVHVGLIFVHIYEGVVELDGCVCRVLVQDVLLDMIHGHPPRLLVVVHLQ